MSKLDKSTYVFMHKFFNAIADSIIKVFVPLIIFKLTGNIFFAFLYLGTKSLLSGLFNILFKKFIIKYGVIAIILHIFPAIATLFILTLCSLNFWLVLLLGFLQSLFQVLYSVPINIIFAMSDKKTNVAKLEIATNIGKFVFIILNGYILGSSLSSSLWIITSVGTLFYILSILPILYSFKMLKNSYDIPTPKYKNVYGKKYKYFNLFHICFGIFQYVLDHILPLYLYINDLSMESISLILALIEVAKLIANYTAKYLISRKKGFLGCCICVALFITSSVMIIFVKLPIVLYVLSCVLGISFPLIFVPMFSCFCKCLKLNNDMNSEMLKRDVCVLTPRSLFIGSYFLFNSFYGFFGIGIVVSLVMLISSAKIYEQSEDEKLLEIILS